MSMSEPTDAAVLREPSAERKKDANITRYTRWLKSGKGYGFDDYTELWERSVTDLEGFWASI